MMPCRTPKNQAGADSATSTTREGLIAIIHRCGEVFFASGEGSPALGAQMRQIGGEVGLSEHPVMEPRGKAFRRARLLVVLSVGGVVAIVVALYWRWMSATGRVDDRKRLHGGSEHAVGIAEDDLRRDDLFGGVDDALRTKGRLFTNAQATPNVRAALGVGPLDMNDRDIRAQRGDKQRGCAIEW